MILFGRGSQCIRPQRPDESAWGRGSVRSFPQPQVRTARAGAPRGCLFPLRHAPALLGCLLPAPLWPASGHQHLHSGWGLHWEDFQVPIPVATVICEALRAASPRGPSTLPTPAGVRGGAASRLGAHPHHPTLQTNKPRHRGLQPLARGIRAADSLGVTPGAAWLSSRLRGSGRALHWPPGLGTRPSAEEPRLSAFTRHHE